MKDKTLYRLPMLVLAFVAVAAVWSLASAGSDYHRRAQQAKAEYYVLEAQKAYLAQEYDKYFQMVRRAYELDSLNSDIAGEWGLVTLLDQYNPDSATVMRGYEAMRRRFLNYPENYFSGVTFANVARQMFYYDDAERTWQLLDSLYPKRSKPSQELADLYLEMFEQGDTAAYYKALAIYERFEQGGKSTELSTAKIRAYALANDTPAIVREIRALDSIGSGDSFTALYVGSLYDHLGMDDEAIAHYNLACSLDSTYGIAYRYRAEYYLEHGDSTAYDREVYQALKSPNLDVDSKEEIIRGYVVKQFTDSTKTESIIDLFDRLAEMHPGESKIHGLYAAYLMVVGRYTEALEQTGYVVDLDPDDDEALNDYIGLLLQTGDTVQAIEKSCDAIRRFPDNLRYPISAAYLYIQTGDTTAAVDVLDAVKIDKVNNPKAVSIFYSSKGDILASAGDTARALEHYDMAIDLNPQNNLALNNAAYFMTLTGGDLDKAERYSMRSLKGDDLNPTYLDTYAWVLYNKKDYNMAKMYIDFALNAYADNAIAEAADSTAQIAADEKTGEKNAEADGKADATSDEADERVSADIYDHAGDIYFMCGEKEQAIRFWEKALKLDPENELLQKKVKYKTIF